MTTESESEFGPHESDSFLDKALCDPFDYMLQLKNGTVFRFHKAKLVRGWWVRLSGVGINDGTSILGGSKNACPPRFDRGVDVLASEIAWIADAPYGS